MRYQRPLRTLVAFEQLSGEMPGAILRQPQFQFADPRHQRPTVVAGAVAEPLWRALAFPRPQGLVHLRFEHLLHDRADYLAQPIRVRKQNVFDRSAGGLTFNLGHGSVPRE